MLGQYLLPDVALYYLGLYFRSQETFSSVMELSTRQWNYKALCHGTTCKLRGTVPELLLKLHGTELRLAKKPLGLGLAGT